MALIKTTAVVEDQEHLRLQNKLESLEKGAEVELTIFLKNNKSENDWQQILSSIGTYSEKFVNVNGKLKFFVKPQL